MPMTAVRRFFSAAILTRGDTHDFLKPTGEMALIGKTGFKGNLRKGKKECPGYERREAGKNEEMWESVENRADHFFGEQRGCPVSGVAGAVKEGWVEKDLTREMLMAKLDQKTNRV